MIVLTAPSLRLISQLEKIQQRSRSGTHRLVVQQRDTRRLIRRRIIEREIHLARNLPGWDASIYQYFQ